MTPADERRLRRSMVDLIAPAEGLHLEPIPRGNEGRLSRAVFDAALTALHYAGRCQRVGRCMRLLILNDGQWVGGIVLGSTFPNVECRDVAFDLKRYVRETSARGLSSPWSWRNHVYWSRLQAVVNHARTFIFPSMQGRGIGVEAHGLLLSAGVDHWRTWYPGPVIGLDTLCDHADSGLFYRNGWEHVGRTKGYGSDRSTIFVASPDRPLRNNVALSRNSRPWEVWIKRLIDSG